MLRNLGYLNTLVALADGGTVVGACVSYDGGLQQQLRRAFIEAAQETFGMDHSGMDDETQAGEWYIDSLCVEESHRKRGVATALVQATCQRAWHEGLPAVGLLVDQGTPKAEALYHSWGFRYIEDAVWGGHPMRHLQIRQMQ